MHEYTIVCIHRRQMFKRAHTRCAPESILNRKNKISKRKKQVKYEATKQESTQHEETQQINTVKVHKHEKTKRKMTEQNNAA